jgi:hypothetical protein
VKTRIGLIALMPAVLFSVYDGAFAAEKATSPPAPGMEKHADKAAPSLMMTGRVTQVDGNTKTFTIVAKGKQHSFVANSFKTLPKVGEVIEVTYTGTTGGTMQATTVKSSKSNSSD